MTKRQLADSIRIKKTSNGVNTFTPFAHYEVDNGTTVKYYTFNGLRVAMRRGSTLYYLHGDHLGSTALTTTGSGVGTSQTYCAGACPEFIEGAKRAAAPPAPAAIPWLRTASSPASSMM